MKKQWCWIFNNLSIFAERPANLDPSFDDLIEDARIKRLTSMDRKDYMKALELSDRDRKVIYEGGIIVGKHLGKEEGREEVAKKMLAKGLDLNLISECTGLTVEQIDALKQ